MKFRKNEDNKRIENYVNNKIYEYNNSPRYSDSVVSNMAKDILDRVDNRNRYLKIEEFYNNLLNGKNNNTKWEKLPADVKKYTFYSYLEEKKDNKTISSSEEEVLNSITSNKKNIPYERGYENVLSLAALNFLGLINLYDLGDYENPKMLKNAIASIFLADLVLNDKEVISKNRLIDIINNVTQCISNLNGKIGFVEDYLNDKYGFDCSNQKGKEL